MTISLSRKLELFNKRINKTPKNEKICYGCKEFSHKDGSFLQNDPYI